MIFRKLALVACKLNRIVVATTYSVVPVLFAMEPSEPKGMETANLLWRQHNASMDQFRACCDLSSITTIVSWL